MPRSSLSGTAMRHEGYSSQFFCVSVKVQKYHSQALTKLNEYICSLNMMLISYFGEKTSLTQALTLCGHQGLRLVNSKNLL